MQEMAKYNKQTLSLQFTKLFTMTELQKSRKLREIRFKFLL